MVEGEAIGEHKHRHTIDLGIVAGVSSHVAAYGTIPRSRFTHSPDPRFAGANVTDR
jgi:hypothetical protein